MANRPTDSDRTLRSVGLGSSRLPVCRSRSVWLQQAGRSRSDSPIPRFCRGIRESVGCQELDKLHARLSAQCNLDRSQQVTRNMRRSRLSGCIESCDFCMYRTEGFSIPSSGNLATDPDRRAIRRNAGELLFSGDKSSTGHSLCTATKTELSDLRVGDLGYQEAQFSLLRALAFTSYSCPNPG